MSIAETMIGQTFKTALYESVVGKIEVEIEVLIDGSVSTTLWVVYPDGCGDEIFTVGEGLEKLELENET
jgi:hypothetical protein